MIRGSKNNKMIKLEKPKLNQRKIVTDCMLNVKDGSFKNNILMSLDEIVKKSSAYDEKAMCGNLTDITAHSFLESGATKEDMKKLYDTKFVPKHEKGRQYYNSIMLLAPNTRCPYCAQRNVRTLDHYLPKSKYPTYAVTAFNLVPSCSDCNAEKQDVIFKHREEEIIHPYYDDFTDKKWIFAEIIEGENIAFEFKVKCPEEWDEIKKKRAENHFDKFKLNDLYKPYAAEEYIACFNRIKRAYLRGGKELAIERLKEDIDDKDTIRLNTWQSAMYQAIIESNWYWDEHLPNVLT